MTSLVRCIRSDFFKLRHTFMLLIHILIPLFAAVVFLAYYSVSLWNANTKLSAYLEAVSIAFPLIIGLISSKAIEQEGLAGGFQTMLCSIQSRTAVFLSKLSVLLLLGSFSVILAVGIFAAGFRTAPGILYVKAAGIIIVENIFLYILHLFISLRYGRGASIGLGIMESLIAALMLTGLGDGIWYIVPCSWSARLCDYLIYTWINPACFAAGNNEMTKGFLISVSLVGIELIACMIWFRNWEGRKTFD